MAVGVERRLGQPGVVEAIDGSPWEVHPVRAGLQHIVRVVEVVVKHQTKLFAGPRELAQAVEIPRIVFGEIILAQAVVGRAKAAARPRHLIEWRPHRRIGPRRKRMVVAAAVIPESRPVLEKPRVGRGQIRGQRIEIFGQTVSGAPGDKTGQAGAEVAGEDRSNLSLPPCRAARVAPEDASTDHEAAVDDHEGLCVGQPDRGGRGRGECEWPRGVCAWLRPPQCPESIDAKPGRQLLAKERRCGGVGHRAVLRSRRALRLDPRCDAVPEDRVRGSPAAPL